MRIYEGISALVQRVGNVSSEGIIFKLRYESQRLLARRRLASERAFQTQGRRAWPLQRRGKYVNMAAG